MGRGRGLRQHVSDANVVATLASQQLRAHSVGKSELKRGAVTGRAVRNRSLGVADLSRSARRSLRGATGPAGPPGVAFHAVIATSGDPTSGNSSGPSHAPGSGDYVVRFGADVTNCTLLATLGNTPAKAGAVPPARRITVSPEQGAVHVRTYNAAGVAVPASFHVAAAC